MSEDRDGDDAVAHGAAEHRDEAAEHRDEDFTEAWEHHDEHDVGADTSQFEAFRQHDTAELIRNQVHGEDDAGRTDDDATGAPAGDPPGRPSSALVVGVLAVVFVVVVVLYLLA